jgi:hypothetical protein
MVPCRGCGRLALVIGQRLLAIAQALRKAMEARAFLLQAAQSLG